MNFCTNSLSHWINGTDAFFSYMNGWFLCVDPMGSEIGTKNSSYQICLGKVGLDQNREDQGTLWETDMASWNMGPEWRWTISFWRRGPSISMLVYRRVPTFEVFEASANRQAQKRPPFFCDGHFPWSICFGFTTQGGGFLVPSKVGSRWVPSRWFSCAFLGVPRVRVA